MRFAIRRGMKRTPFYFAVGQKQECASCAACSFCTRHQTSSGRPCIVREVGQQIASFDFGADAANLSTKLIEQGILALWGNRGFLMPLTRGRILGYDNERMAFRFSMSENGKDVECRISAAAIDELVGGPRGSCVDRETQFLKLREAIERLATAKFDAGTFVRGSILRIFAKDIPSNTRGRSLAVALGHQGARHDHSDGALHRRQQVGRTKE
jgi:hypothetical protein